MIHHNFAEIPEQVHAARSLVIFAKERGWAWEVVPVQTDMAGDPFFRVHLKSPAGEGFQICWHTRATGGKSYRLFSKIWRPAGRGTWVDAPSLKQIRRAIQAEYDEREGAQGERDQGPGL